MICTVLVLPNLSTQSTRIKKEGPALLKRAGENTVDACIVCVLYVYSRVMEGGGGVITNYSRGAGTCIYMWYPRHL